MLICYYITVKQTAILRGFHSVRAFARQHDDLPAFHAAFLVLMLLAAAMLNLGFFGVLILIHVGLDIVKYRDVHHLSWHRTLEGALREGIVDITLLAFALVVAIYLHPTLTGLAGIKGLMLAELTIVRGTGIVVPKIKILYDFLKILYHVELYLDTIHPLLGKKLSIVEVTCMFSLAVTLALLVAAPLLLDLSTQDYIHMILSEAIPWKL